MNGARRAAIIVIIAAIRTTIIEISTLPSFSIIMKLLIATAHTMPRIRVRNAFFKGCYITFEMRKIL